jgi:hypothetical protein
VDGNSTSNQKKSALKKVNDKKMKERNTNSSTSNQKKSAPKKVNDKKTNERNSTKSDDLGEVNNTTFKCDNNTKMLLFSIPSVEMISRRRLQRTLSHQ